MYSPTYGRFLQTDPIGYGDGMNMYAYVGNDPVNGVDPSGMSCAAAAGTPCVIDVSGSRPGYGGVIGSGVGPMTMPPGPYSIESYCANPGAYHAFGFVLDASACGYGDGGGSGVNQDEVAGEPQRDGPCPLPGDVSRTYRNNRDTAIDLFRSIGSDKEVAYTIFRKNRYGNLESYFEIGESGRVAPTIDRPGLTPVLVGHIHDVPVGPTGLFGWAHRGASGGDIGSKSYYPSSTTFVLHEQVAGEWKDSCF